MDRRSFLNTFIGGIVGSAAIRTWPFRVYSFPSNIAAPVLFVDSESIKLISWDPENGRLIAKRGANGFYELPLPPSPPYKIIDSHVRSTQMKGIVGACFGFEFDKEANVDALTIPIRVNQLGS